MIYTYLSLFTESKAAQASLIISKYDTPQCHFVVESGTDGCNSGMYVAFNILFTFSSFTFYTLSLLHFITSKRMCVLCKRSWGVAHKPRRANHPAGCISNSQPFRIRTNSLNENLANSFILGTFTPWNRNFCSMERNGLGTNGNFRYLELSFPNSPLDSMMLICSPASTVFRAMPIL